MIDQINISCSSYEAFFQNCPDMIFIASTEGIFKKLNSAFVNNLGYNEAELFSRSYLEFIHPDDQEKSIQEMKKMARGHCTINFENRYLTSCDSYKLLDWTVVPFVNEQFVFAIGRDITSKSEGQEFILETILDNIPDMIFVKEASS